MHPIPDAPDMPLEDRVRHLECMLARLWDQVWWMALPESQRNVYRSDGFTDPIEAFYLD
jgi:hypothetical protein